MPDTVRGVPATYDTLSALNAGFDLAAAVTPDVSSYCSGRDWAISATEHLHPGRTPVIAHSGGSWLALTHGTHDQIGPYLQGLEADWGFSSAVLGADPKEAGALTAARLVELQADWHVTLLNGLSDLLVDAIIPPLLGRYRIARRPGIVCQLANLEGGMDAFLARRSATFRRNLRRDARRAQAQGITLNAVDPGSDPGPVLARVLAVEKNSWKSHEGQSVLASPRYFAFYEATLRRAAQRQQLRAFFATRDGIDYGYVFGGVLAGTYRGFQLGYDATLARLGLGNLLQLALIEQLCGEGVRSYDLGMEMPYKTRWSDRRLALQTLVLVNPSRDT